MQNVVKKVYISILTCVIVMITMVATTFAWVGILTTTSVGGFNIDISSSKKNNDYELLISTNGTDFSQSVSSIDIKKQILTNMGIDYSILSNPDDERTINTFFDRFAKMEPVSASLENNQFSDFYAIEVDQSNHTISFTNSKKYYQFDLYLMISSKVPITSETNINSNLLISGLENAITGVECTGSLLNGNPFEPIPSGFKYDLLKDLPEKITVNSASSARLALSVYNPIRVEDSYTNDTPVNTIIYQGGTNEPSLIDGVYSFGGILPEEYNLALKELNTTYKTNYNTTEVLETRNNDIEISTGDPVIWKKQNVDSNSLNFFGIQNQVSTKIKLTVRFWFEGWDADCLQFIDHSNIYLNLNFAVDL